MGTGFLWYVHHLGTPRMKSKLFPSPPPCYSQLLVGEPQRGQAVANETVVQFVGTSLSCNGHSQLLDRAPLRTVLWYYYNV